MNFNRKEGVSDFDLKGWNLSIFSQSKFMSVYYISRQLAHLKGR